MTILEAANKLLEYFSTKDSFSMEENYKDIILISEDPDNDKITFALALEDLEKTEIIKGHTQGKKKVYILKKPLNSYTQGVNIDGFTCNMIAKIINDFCDKIKDKKDYCDAKNINEKDIRNLIFLVSFNFGQQKQDLD